MILILQGSTCMELGHFIQLAGDRESPGGGKISWNQPSEREGKMGCGENIMCPQWLSLQGPQLQSSEFVVGAPLIHIVGTLSPALCLPGPQIG